MTEADATSEPTGPLKITCSFEPRPASVEEILQRTVPWPRFERMRREVASAPSGDVDDLVAKALSEMTSAVLPGQRIAVAVGSRGITDIAKIVASAVVALRSVGAEPFIVPAMGSHGGATAEGQTAVLAKLGITEETMGAPIRATMEVVDLGEVQPGLRACLDAYAAASDGILVINRLKSHTSFDGQIQSGLAKMLAIGLGKQVGAEGLHSRGPGQIEQRIRAVARAIVSAKPVVGGLALLEGPGHELRHVEFVGASDIGGEVEAALLRKAMAWEPRLPVDEIDVLIVDVMGKDKSGTGMDTNVIGRRMIRGSAEPAAPRITNIVVLSLSEASGGNATGLGLADFVPARLMTRVDLASTYANALTAGLQGVQRAQIPVVLASDRDAVAAALMTTAVPDPEQLRVVRVRDTLSLDDLMVSTSLVDACLDRGFTGAAADTGSRLEFDEHGEISPW